MKKFGLIFCALLLAGAGCYQSGELPGQEDILDNLDAPEQEEQQEENGSDEEPTEADSEPLDEPSEEESQAPAEETAETDTSSRFADNEKKETVTTQPEEKLVEVNTRTEQETTVEITQPAMQAVNMEAGNFFFKPAKITAAPGQKVNITFTKNSGFHTIVIDEIGFKASVAEGATVSFTAPTSPGSYAYYCDVGNHRAFGMEGVLVVE